MKGHDRKVRTPNGCVHYSAQIGELMKIPSISLVNEVRVPCIGLGLDQVSNNNQAYEALLSAFLVGYRSIDTASSYKNEEAVGKAVKDSGLSRDELYITTKLTAADQGYEAALRAFDRSMQALQLDYLDCFLIHWPGKYLYTETWRAFEKLYQQGCVKVIGVCNFNPHHIETLKENTDILPMVNQVESHPYFPQDNILDYCKQNDILMEAWSPLMCGGIILEEAVVMKIAKEVQKTPAQVVLRWHIQKEHRIFPKSVTPSRIKENFEIFDFCLTQNQMTAMDSLAIRNLRIGPNPDIFFEV